MTRKKIVMLGSVTEYSSGVSQRTRLGFRVDVTYNLQGYVLNVQKSQTSKWYRPFIPLDQIGKNLDTRDTLPWVTEDMFVLYDDYFSERPTQEEIENFAMIHGFTPCLIEV